MYSTQLGFFISWFCASYPRKPNYVKIGMELCFILYAIPFHSRTDGQQAHPAAGVHFWTTRVGKETILII